MGPGAAYAGIVRDHTPDAGATIAAALLARVDELAQVLVDRIRDYIEVYRADGVVPADDLYTAATISKQILGELLDLPEADRELLLTTMATYFAVDGSASEAAERLYCHPNTVRYRLRRIEQLSGRSFDRRLDSAELYIALDAVRRLPDCRISVP